MPKRKASHDLGKDSPIIKIELDIDLKKGALECPDIEIPDLSRINIDEIENTIFEAVKRNNFSNAKAKYLIKQMLKHPNVVDWFRNIFSSDNPEFSLSYEPRVTRAAKRRYGDDPGTSSELSASMIGRLLLSAPTITSVDFDAEDCTDRDYSPDTDQSDSDESSVLTADAVEESDLAPPSPYLTRSKITISDLQVDLLDDSVAVLDEEDSQNQDSFKHEHSTLDSFIHNYQWDGNLSLEEMHNLMETDVDGQLYHEFKRDLNMDTPRNDNCDDDPEFDVFAQIDDLDEDIFDDCRDDRSVKIPKSELWALLKDNNLVDGSENSSTNKKTITMLYDKEAIVQREPCSDVRNLLAATDDNGSESALDISEEQRTRLQRQMSMFYQGLATNFVMLYDQAQFSRLVAAQVDLYFKMAANIGNDNDSLRRPSVFDPANRVIVENILLNYKGMNYLPTSRFTRGICHKKVEFPKCLIATLLCSSAFPYRELLPTSFKLYNSAETVLLRPTPFLASEDKLLTLGIIEFGHQSHRMLKLIHKYLFPIRSTEQLRYRKTNILRRHKDLDSAESALLVDLLQFSSWYHDNKSSTLKVSSVLAKVPLTDSCIWQRNDEWRHLPDVYRRFLRKTVPDQMLGLDLCSREEYSRAKKLATGNKTAVEKQMQYCNWSALPWEMERVTVVKTDSKRPYFKSILRKIVKEKSFPQYEIPKNSNFRKLLQKWNCYFENKAQSSSKKNKSGKKKMVTKKRSDILGLRHALKLVQKSKKILMTAKLKRAKITKLMTQQSYAHYFRNEDTEKLFPESIFRNRLEELLQGKNQKSLRLLRFQDKCRLREGDIVDIFAPFSTNKDEDDLRFCRNLLNNMQRSLSTEHYEQCLSTINRFHLDEGNDNVDGDVLELMKYLIDIVKSQDGNIDVYEDLLYLLTPEQALRLGCEIEYNRIKNVNQLYLMTKGTRNGMNRRFWIRLSALMSKAEDGTCCTAKVIQYLTNNLKHNPYLQSLIAPLLNCWDTPFPNFPETFANFDFLGASNCWSQFTEDAETDNWEYSTELSEPSKGLCECSCHDTAPSKEGAATKHCTKCSLKVSNGSIYLDEGKLHKRLVRFKWPSDIARPSIVRPYEDLSRTTKTDLLHSMSVMDYLRSKSVVATNLHNRCISVKDIHVLEQRKPTCLRVESQCLEYMQVLRDDDAAMDTDLFRQIKGQPRVAAELSEVDLKIPNFEGTVKQELVVVARDWSQEDNLVLLTECQRSGPCQATFEYLREAHFLDRSLVDIEDHFNGLFQQLIEYHQQRGATEAL